jgi:uncharacterized protein YdaU (DUF1376 family)
LFYFPFNYGDFTRKTAGLSEKNRLAYLYLVAMYYEQEGPIHHELTRLSLRTGISPDEVYALLNAFFECRDDYWHSDKIDADIVAYKKKSKERSESGKKGAASRWKLTVVK